ncbi:MAG: putative DNA binding domain-containing protein [Deltaproteobacteria bacterium]|nr:putative DNA binding domain-containing protein [Deltaproteobacteria bacterium]
MDWLDILRRIESGEDDRTEFKRGAGDLKPIGRAIAAFANSDGGIIMLGVDDIGTIVGVREAPDSVTERLTACLQSGLSAPVQARIGRNLDPLGWVHWIEVPRQRGFEPLRHEGRVLVRRGRANGEPSPAELQDMYNAFGCIMTEERTIDAARLDSIDFQAFREYLGWLGLDVAGEPQPDPESDLRARGVVTDIGGETRATLYGVLAFGRTPQSYPQTRSFFVECVAYGGNDQSAEVLQAAEGKGRIHEQVERAVGWLMGLRRNESLRGLTREDVPLVPVAAAREVLVNAVAHRDYAITGSKILVEVFLDRVVVTSPGSLPNGLTIESVVRGGNPRSRNESMANFLVSARKMEQRGRGWPIVRRAMSRHNGTEPEILEDRSARFVRVTLRLGSGRPDGGPEGG